MNAVRGRVRDEHAEVQGELPAESDVVVVNTESPEEPFELADDEIAELEARMASAARDEIVAAADLMQTLRSRR